MWIFLLSLSVLFLASIVGVLVVRLRADEWRPAGAPSYPATLWLSTFLLLLSSVTAHRGLQAVRADRQRALRQSLAATLALGVAFLMLQGVNWVQLVLSGVTARSGLFAFSFYLLTALHALHVIAGLVPLSIVFGRARRGFYHAESLAGVRYVAMYWHFLDAVWIVLFALLLLS
jgi:heme/copper-type cytochrome/quinol oxidase subunit 3